MNIFICHNALIIIQNLAYMLISHLHGIKAWYLLLICVDIVANKIIASLSETTLKNDRHVPLKRLHGSHILTHEEASLSL